VNIACPETDDAVPRLEPASDFECDLLSVCFEDHRFVTVALRFIDDGLSADSRNRHLAGWVNIRDHYEVRVVK
jgi:hypothetical protein